MHALNGFDHIPPHEVYTADYDAHGEGCKAVLCEQLGVTLFFDDFIGYVAEPTDTIRLLVMPNSKRPYYHESWKMLDGEPEFGRRVYRKDRG